MPTNRQENILNYLYRHPKPVYGAELAHALGITTRTLRTEINAINSEYASRCIQIHSSPRAGYWLNPEDRANFTLRKDAPVLASDLPSVPEDREIYLYFRLLTAKDYLTMETLSNEMFQSKTTISKDIHSMQQLVHCVEGVTLEISRKKGIRLNGDEQYIRHLVSGILLYYQMQFIDSLHHAISRFYPQHAMLDRLYYLLVDCLLDQDIIITGPSMQIFAMEIFIIFQRKQSGYELTANSDATYREVALPVREMEELFGVLLTQQDRISILQLLRHKRYLNTSTDREEHSLGMQKVANLFLEKVKQDYGFDFEANESLRSHIYALLTYHHLTFRKRTMLVQEIQHNYPYAYEVACCISPFAEDVLGYHLQENELSRFAVRLVVAMDAIPQRKRVLLVADSASYAELVRFKLRTYFSHKIEFCGGCPTYQAEKLLASISPPVELVLATVQLPQPLKIDTLHISPVMNQQDINLLNDYFFRSNHSYCQKQAMH